MGTILIVESDRITAELIAGLFRREVREHETVTAITEDEVRQAAELRPVELTLIRYGPTLGPIIEFLDNLDSRPRIVVSNVHPGSREREKLPDAVDAVLPGVRTADDLVTKVERELERQREMA